MKAMGWVAVSQENRTLFLSPVPFQSFLYGMGLELTCISLQEHVSFHWVACTGAKVKVCDGDGVFMLS